jgi:hypothetical protein
MARGGAIQWGGDTRPYVRLLLWALIAITVGAIAVFSIKLWTLSRSTGSRQDDTTSASAVAQSKTTDAGAEANAGTPASNRDAGGRNESFRFATERYENSAAGYSFRYPNQWRLIRQGTAVRLARPDGHFVVSFGLGPAGGLPVAYDRFVSLLGRTYSDVVVEEVDATRVRGSVGVVLEGSATGAGGVRVRFLATLLERPNGRPSIGALAASDVSSAAFPPAVREVLASFQPI